MSCDRKMLSSMRQPAGALLRGFARPRQAGSDGEAGGIGLGAGFRMTFLTLAFFAGALRVIAFFAAAFLAGAFFAAAFFAGAFLAAAFFAGAFFAADFFAADFFTVDFFAADFFTVDFFAALFFAAVFFTALFFAGAFFVVAFTMLELPSDNRQSVHTPTRGLSSVALFMSHARGIA